MIQLRSTFAVSDIERGLNEMAKRGKYPGVVLRAFRGPARKDQAQHARDKEDQDGGAWPARARATTFGRGAKRARARGRRLLGRLPTSLAVTVTRTRLIVDSRIPWSNIHQTGGRAGKGAQIPRREFLWWSPSLLREVAKSLTEHVGEGW